MRYHTGQHTQQLLTSPPDRRLTKPPCTAISSRNFRGLSKLPKSLLNGVAVFCLATFVSACASNKSTQLDDASSPAPGNQTTVVSEQSPETPTTTVASAPPATQPTVEPVPQAEQPVATAPAEPPAPTDRTEVAQAPPIPESKPEVPAESSETVVEVVTVTDEPATATETVEVVETEDRVVMRSETTTKSDRIVERVEVDEGTGRVEEDVAVIETTRTETDTVVVDKATGEAVETVVVSEPKEEVVAAARVEITPEKPRDQRRLFAGPEQYPPTEYAAYAVMAIRADTPASDRERVRMICEAFIAAEAAEDEADIVPAETMVTIWPVSSTDRAVELNRAPRNEICTEAVNRYGLAIGHRAILDTEKTGWILDNPGPYLLAWAPGAVKGELDARVLLLDLTAVSDPGQAAEFMGSWSEIERDTSLRTESGWNLEAVQARMSLWASEHGSRSLMLLGPVEG